MLEVKNIQIQFGNFHIIEKGNFLARNGFITGIVGDSGSGKSSLLNILSLNDFEQHYKYKLNNMHINETTTKKINTIKRTEIAYLKQDCLFLNSMSALDLILLESEITGVPMTKDNAKALLCQMQLQDVYPSQLSGGEKQRLAIALAIAKDANIIICDEITSALDEENTQMILDILLHLAHDLNKTVILSTHEKDVMNIMDDVYRIENKEIKLVKTSSVFRIELGQKQRKLSHSYIWKTTFARFKKHQFRLILTILIGALATSLLWFSTASFEERKAIWNEMLEETGANEFLIVNGNSRATLLGTSYSDELFPVDHQVIEKIEKINGVKAVYPFLSFLVVKQNSENYQERTQCHLTVLKNNEIVIDKTLSYSEPHLNNLATDVIFPHFPKQNLYSLCEKKTSEENGIYIDYFIAEALGLTDLEEGMTLKLKIYPPVAAFDYVSQGFATDENGNDYPISQKMQAPVYDQGIEMEIPISGILPRHFSDNALASSRVPMYIPQEMFMNYFNEAKSNYQLKPKEYPYEIRAYKLYFSNSVNRNELKQEILSISPDVLVSDTYANKVALSNSAKDNSDFLSFASKALFLIVIVLMLVYGSQHKNEIKPDFEFFKIRGISKRERKRIDLIEMISLFIFISLPAILLSHYLFNNGIMHQYFLKGIVPLSTYPYMLLTNILIAFLLAFLSELALLRTKE